MGIGFTRAARAGLVGGLVGVSAMVPAVAATSGGSAPVPQPALGALPLLLGQLNAAREGAGLQSLALATDLDQVATAHSLAMAGASSLFHNPSLSADVGGWTLLGENVGAGYSAGSIANAFMASSEHRANILTGAFQQVGIGAVVVGSLLWVTEDFRDPVQPPPPAAPLAVVAPLGAPPSLAGAAAGIGSAPTSAATPVHPLVAVAAAPAPPTQPAPLIRPAPSTRPRLVAVPASPVWAAAPSGLPTVATTRSYQSVPTRRVAGVAARAGMGKARASLDLQLTRRPPSPGRGAPWSVVAALLLGAVAAFLIRSVRAIAPA